MTNPAYHTTEKTLKGRLHRVIFEANTTAGKIFDIILLCLILGSLITVLLESVPAIAARHQTLFTTLEWTYTIVFTIEYLLRLYCVQKPAKYAKSFYGIIDLMAILPTYMELFLPNTHFLLVIRSFRLLRIFRVFKLISFLHESKHLLLALWSSRRKIMVFLFFVLLLTIILGSFMYVIEVNHNEGFHSIPQSIYWAIVTLTTVGYGDVAPVTPLGKTLASFIMILGYAIIAVPTGIFTVSFLDENRNRKSAAAELRCAHCNKKGHDSDAIFCDNCGQPLPKP
jgi:voltage-gated potassium channel